MIIEVPYYKQETKYSCGPAALRMLLSYFDIHETEEKLVSLMKCSSCNGTDNSSFKRILEEFNLVCKEMTQITYDTVVELLKEKTPLLVNYQNIHDKRGHFALVVGVKGDELILNDPEYGENYHISRDVFCDHWQSHDGEYIHWGCIASK